MFCRAVYDVSAVDVGDGKLKNLLTGEIHVLPYACIKTHVFEERLQLI